MSDVRMDEEKTFGGCEGPDAMYVKLISSDGHEFIVKRDHALTSGTIKAMLSGPGMQISDVKLKGGELPGDFQFFIHGSCSACCCYFLSSAGILST